MAEVRAPVAGASGIDQHHEHEDAKDDDEDDEPARHVAGALQGQPFCRGKPDSAEHAQINRWSVLQPLLRDRALLESVLKPGSSRQSTRTRANCTQLKTPLTRE